MLSGRSSPGTIASELYMQVCLGLFGRSDIVLFRCKIVEFVLEIQHFNFGMGGKGACGGGKGGRALEGLRAVMMGMQRTRGRFLDSLNFIDAGIYHYSLHLFTQFFTLHPAPYTLHSTPSTPCTPRLNLPTTNPS